MRVGVVLILLSLIYHFSFHSPSLLETAQFRLKYWLKGPLNPCEPSIPPANQPIDHLRHFSLTNSLLRVIWLVVWFGLYGPLRQYFSLYRAVSQREGERGEKRIVESKNVQTTPTRTYYKCSRPMPYCNLNCRTPRHWKFTQHHRTTRTLPCFV